MRSSVPLRSSSATGGDPFVPLPGWKRALDLCFCLLVFPAFICVAAGFWLLLRLSSPGPVLFRQERVGYRGRRFPLYKFRTMRPGADTGVHHAHVASLYRSNAPMQKLDGAGDGRLIPGGWLLRATGIDELPQVLNIIRGEMSIVGPRPCIPYEFEQYSPRHRQRLSAVPGVTGLWQVSGKNRTTFEEMVRLDVQYAQTRSLTGDLAIILRTPAALWTQLRDTRARRAAAGKPATANVPPGTAASRA